MKLTLRGVFITLVLSAAFFFAKFYQEICRPDPTVAHAIATGAIMLEVFGGLYLEWRAAGGAT